MLSIGSSWSLARGAINSCRQSRTALTILTPGPRQGHGYSCQLFQYRGDCWSFSAAAAGTDNVKSKSRAYPTEPRVGVGVVVFRTQPVQGQDPEILLVRRAKEPDKGRWCFPGGSLELGETLAACAAREVAEEAGLRLHGAMPDGAAAAAAATAAAAAARTSNGRGGGLGETELPAAGGRGALSLVEIGPTPFAAVDVMSRDPDGKIRFHYAVIEVAAVSEDPAGEPVPGDDADGAQWVPVSRLRGLADLTARCDEMAEEAVRRFAVAVLPRA